MNLISLRSPGGMRAATLGFAVVLSVPIALATSGVAAAQDDGKFCSGTNIVFFPGGTPGGGFETVVYNGAKAAEAAFGPTVSYQWSDWDPETDDHPVPARPWRPRPTASRSWATRATRRSTPLIDDARRQGILVTVMNTELPETEAKYAAAGTGYVGAVAPRRRRRARERGDQARRPRSPATRCSSGASRASPGAVSGRWASPTPSRRPGMNVVYLEIDDATNADPAAGVSDLHRVWPRRTRT